MKIAEISYGDFSDSVLRSFAIYNKTLENFPSVIDEHDDDDYLIFIDRKHPAIKLFTISKKDNQTIPVFEDFGRKYVNPIDQNGKRHILFLLNPSVKFGL